MTAQRRIQARWAAVREAASPEAGVPMDRPFPPTPDAVLYPTVNRVEKKGKTGYKTDESSAKLLEQGRIRGILDTGAHPGIDLGALQPLL